MSKKTINISKIQFSIKDIPIELGETLREKYIKLAEENKRSDYLSEIVMRHELSLLGYNYSDIYPDSAVTDNLKATQGVQSRLQELEQLLTKEREEKENLEQRLDNIDTKLTEYLDLIKSGNVSVSPQDTEQEQAPEKPEEVSADADSFLQAMLDI